MQTFSGAWPALVTPFTDADQVNVAVLRDLVDYLIDKQAAGLYICGSTGEGIYMSVAERKLVAETVMAQTAGRVPIIAHIGAVAWPDAVELARHAAQLRVDGISSIIPPLYRNRDSLLAYYAAIAEAVPDLPLLPYILSPDFDVVTLMRELLEIPSVAGTKYTGPNMFEFRQIVELRAENWSVFSGMDEQCAYAAMMGSGGNIGSTLNFMPGVYRAIRQAVAAGDLAQAHHLQLRANRVTEAAMGFGFMGALKAMMTALGYPCGQPRLPNRPFPASDQAALQAALDAVGYAELNAM